jgi:hypothetical protein
MGKDVFLACMDALVPCAVMGTRWALFIGAPGARRPAPKGSSSMDMAPVFMLRVPREVALGFYAVASAWFFSVACSCLTKIRGVTRKWLGRRLVAASLFPGEARAGGPMSAFLLR